MSPVAVPEIHLLKRFGDLPAVADALFPAGHPFLCRAFLAGLEDSGVVSAETGWQPLHLVAQQDGGVVGLLPLYLKSHSHGDFIYDWNWAPVWTRRGQAYYPRLFSGLPYTPVTGPRLLVAAGVDPAPVRAALRRAAQQLTATHGWSTWHVGLVDASDAAMLDAGGLLVSDDVQFHWRDRGFGDFAGFLASFSAEKRRKVRAERRRAVASGLAIRIRAGDEVADADWPLLHALYRSTFERFGNHAALTVDCLRTWARTLGARMVVFTAEDATGPVALSLCFRSDDTLYGRYWGAARPVDCLHFELCLYQGIEYCLRHGLTCFEPGAGGEHKITRGFVPQPVRSLHWIADPELRRLLAPHLARGQDAVQDYRDEQTRHLPYRTNAFSAESAPP